MSRWMMVGAIVVAKLKVVKKWDGGEDDDDTDDDEDFLVAMLRYNAAELLMKTTKELHNLKTMLMKARNEHMYESKCCKVR
jgi:hypothetical protein